MFGPRESFWPSPEGGHGAAQSDPSAPCDAAPQRLLPLPAGTAPVNCLTRVCPAAGRSGPALCSRVVGDAGPVCQAVLSSEPWQGLGVLRPRLQRARAVGSCRAGEADPRSWGMLRSRLREHLGPAAWQGLQVGVGQDTCPGLDLAPWGRDPGTLSVPFPCCDEEPQHLLQPRPCPRPLATGWALDLYCKAWLERLCRF